MSRLPASLSKGVKVETRDGIVDVVETGVVETGVVETGDEDRGSKGAGGIFLDAFLKVSIHFFFSTTFGAIKMSELSSRRRTSNEL